MTRLTKLAFTMLLLVAVPASAQVPRTMSYQGVLTDAGGNIVPNGFYDVTFRIYDVPAAGVALWTEARTGVNHVQVSRGGFSVTLGSLTPLALAFDGQLYLGVQLAADPELTPRVALASSPYAMGLRLPFILSSTAGTPLLSGYDFSGLGVALDAFSPGGIYNWALEPDVSGSGGYFAVTGNTGSFFVDGNSGVGGSPLVGIVGSTQGAYIDMNAAGDASILFPADAISASEILDEPGVAQGHVNGTVTIPIGSTMGDIVTVTLTTPAAGYIVVEADAQHGLGGGPTSSYNYAFLQIDETAGGVTENNHYFATGYSGPVGARNTFTYAPVSVRRTYFEPAGTYTFRLEASGSQDGALSNYLWNPTITARFYPTSYGSVTAAPPVAQAGQFQDVKATFSAGNGPGQAAVQGQLVDLRELELRAARTAADAERAQRQLYEARAAAQARTRDEAATAMKAKK